MRAKSRASKMPAHTAAALLASVPADQFLSEVKIVAFERSVDFQRFTPADVATLLEAYRGEVIPTEISGWMISGLRHGGSGELGRARTSVHDEAVIRVAHREYKALLPSLQADANIPNSLFNGFRSKRWWKGPPSEQAFQLVVRRYQALLPDRAMSTLRRLIRVRQYEN